MEGRDRGRKRTWKEPEEKACGSGRKRRGKETEEGRNGREADGSERGSERASCQGSQYTHNNSELQCELMSWTVLQCPYAPTAGAFGSHEATLLALLDSTSNLPASTPWRARCQRRNERKPILSGKQIRSRRQDDFGFGIIESLRTSNMGACKTIEPHSVRLTHTWRRLPFVFSIDTLTLTTMENAACEEPVNHCLEPQVPLGRIHNLACLLRVLHKLWLAAQGLQTQRRVGGGESGGGLH